MVKVEGGQKTLLVPVVEQGLPGVFWRGTGWRGSKMQQGTGQVESK